MAVLHYKSAQITNATATPPVANSANVRNGNLRESQALFTIVTGDSATSTYRLFRIRSSDRVSLIRIYSPDVGTTATLNLGLYDKSDVSSGAVVDADFFASAVVINAGALNGTDLTFEATAAGGAIANAEKMVWQCIPSGPTADPCKEYDVVANLAADSDAGGQILVRMQFVSGE
jgi:hypothetical protein